MKNKITILSFLLMYALVSGQDWNGIPIPTNPPIDMEWELQASSDDFNYTSSASPKSSEFLEKWDDYYHNAWSGPGLTIWSRTKSLVENSTLQIPATRLNTANISTGCITSRETIIYPAYVEVYAKVMNSTLASDVWLLSPDDTQEIDILEAYGDVNPTRDPINVWFGERIHLSHHVFIRQPFADWQPTTPDTWYYDSTIWKDGYHRFGVYWRDPLHLEYYIDGVLVKTTSGIEQIDPLHHTNTVNPGDTSNDTRTGLNKAMDIIINVEDQTWRSNQGLTPTNTELANTDDHTFKVDWIRVYKAVNPLSVEDENAESIRMFPNPVLNSLQIESNSRIKNVSIYNLNGVLIKIESLTETTNTIDLSELANGLYILKFQKDDRISFYKKIIKKAN